MSAAPAVPVVDESEVEISAVRAQGAGGQNVNKVSSAIHLRFDVAASSLPEAVKARLLASSDRRLSEEGQLDLLPPKERISMLAELERLENHLGGVADMKRQPDAMLVVDLRKEAIAVREARRLNLPVVALVDTNCDPDEADYVIPGNDDAIKSCDLVIRTIADAMEAGKQKVKPEEFQAEAAPAPAPAAEPEAPSEEAAADEQVSQGESAEETAKAEEVTAE